MEEIKNLYGVFFTEFSKLKKNSTIFKVGEF